MPVKVMNKFYSHIVKVTKRNAMLFSIIMVAICIIGAGLGQVLLKTGVNQLGNVTGFSDFFQMRTFLKIITNPYIIIAFACYVLIVFLWLGAMANMNISFLFPLSSLAYLVTAIAAWLLLKEAVSPLHWIGIGLIIGGCILIAVSKA